MEEQLLEINLISAQSLSSGTRNRMQTYAVAWVDPSMRLRTRVDRIGAENPTWNDKFIFRTTKEFLAVDTSAVNVEIYNVGFIKDKLVGSVRLLVNNYLGDSQGTPSFAAVQIRRPSGRFLGVLNVAVTVLVDKDYESLSGASAIGYRDLMGESFRRGSFRKKRRAKSEQFDTPSFDSVSVGGDSADFSDGGDSSTGSTPLKELNGSDGRRSFCGIPLHKSIQSSPSVPNLHYYLDENKGG